jgi:ferredoxin
MSYKISIDKDACIGCGACTGVSPDFYKMTDDGKAEPVKGQVDDLGNAKDGQDSCPVSCIKIE